jgi:hypothetical protein
MGMTGHLVAVTDGEIAALLADPESVLELLDDESEERARLDLERTWHAIHFLLNGSAWEGDPPLGFLVVGGRPIGDIDVGYGPARAFDASEIRTLATELGDIDWPTLWRYWDPDDARDADVYTMGKLPPALARDYVAPYYAALVEFVTALAARGLGALVHLS